MIQNELMSDMLLKVIALLGFAAFLAVLAIYVPTLDLVIVLAVVIAMSIYDFLIRPSLARRRRRRV
jgi:hypothetical protein